MGSSLTLSFYDEASGRTAEVPVASLRFNIGRSPDNDLAIPHQSLSRRHALVENFDGEFYLSDCGSQNGTTLNGREVTSPALLRDSDRIVLGGDVELLVRLSRNEEQHARAAAQPAHGHVVVPPHVAAPSPPAAARASFGGLSPALIALAAGAVIILIAVVVIVVVVKRRDGGAGRTTRRQVVQNTARENRTGGTPRTGGTQTATPTDARNSSVPTEPSSPESERVEQAAVQVMRRVSSDDKPYVFNEAALRDIARKVGEYRGSAELRAALAAMRREGAALATAARNEGLEPDLVFYAGLAVADGGRGGRDAPSTAREMIPNLVALRATFGSGDADSSLIIMAAYADGGTGSKKSHPMLATMRRIVDNPLTQRNVWFLNERGGLSPQAYDLVLRFLALGVVAQNPRQFGIEADPLAF